MFPNPNDSVVGLREVTHIVVEIIHPFLIISLLAGRGLCLPYEDIFPCWFSLGYSRSKFFLEAVDSSFISSLDIMLNTFYKNTK